MLPRTSVMRHSSPNGTNSGLLFRCRRIDFGDPAQAVGFGRMRPRDEGSTNLGRVPAGFHTEAKRFFSHDVTGREILHQVLSVGPFHLTGTGRMKCSLVLTRAHTSSQHRFVRSG